MKRLNKEFMSPQVKELGEDTLGFVASDETVDRYGDIVRASGWVLDSFKKNPVVLLFHKYNSLPVGQAPDIEVRGTQLVAPVQFARNESPEADIAFRLVRGNFLRGMSVGFDYLSREEDLEQCPGWIYTKQELWEISLTPVPANPNAVRRAVQGEVISEQEADLWLEQMEKALPLPRIEAIEKQLQELLQKISDNPSPDPDQAKELADQVAELQARLKALEQGQAQEKPEIKTKVDVTVDEETLAGAVREAVKKAAGDAVKKAIKYQQGKV